MDYPGGNCSLQIPKEAKDAVRAWNIGRVENCRYVRQGEVNHNFFIRTSKGKYVLRQAAHHRTSAELEFELSYLNYLRDANFPYRIPAAIPTTNGELFIALQGRFYWLYEFLEGTFVETLNKSRLTQLARMMATYHLLIEKSHLNNGKPHSDLFNRTPVLKEIGDYRAEILRRNRANRADAAFVKESKILEPMLRGLDESPYSNMKRYPIHGDINPQNLIWKNGVLVGLLDFENVSTTNGPTIRDISQCYNTAFRDAKVKYRLDLNLAKQFLTYYKQYHLMSDKEVRH
ncbi:MAG: hypothetical protein AUF79_10440 [Crenarchaeota archaeon 13_1_20CM_2_51_8]|nr:MAG: hypothetical protein AUF79_10440 [Crenarchaeota archaeon 13_1_20CM_2_51_8]